MTHLASGQVRFLRDSIVGSVGSGRVQGSNMLVATSGCKSFGGGGDTIVGLVTVGTGSS